MKLLPIPPGALLSGFALAAAITLSACGGGGNTAASPPAPVVAMSDVDGLVVDGIITGAVVCLDTGNGAGGAPNGLCDAGEPQAVTGANGRYSFRAPSADVGRFAVVAVAGGAARDADRPGQTLNFIISAPPGRPSVISPLSTLVHTYARSMAGSGTITTATIADADAAVGSQLGISGTLLADFTTDSSSNGRRAANIGRVVALTQETQVLAAAPITSTATNTATGFVSRADLELLINRRLLDVLDAIAASVADGTLTSAEISAIAMNIVTTNGFTSATVAAGVNANNQQAAAAPAPEASTPVASARLAWFNFTSLQNFFLRAFMQTAAEATPDSNNRTRFHEVREGVGVASNQSVTRNNTVFFINGVWMTCPIGTVGENSPRNAQGMSTTFNYCGFASTSLRSARDISGANMASIIREFRAWPYSSRFAPTGSRNFEAWGPDPSNPLISATFPAGSQILYQVTTDTATPSFYDGTSTTAQIRIASDNIHMANQAGCDERGTQSTVIPSTPTMSLDALFTRYIGRFCDFSANATTATGPRNENWSFGTIGIGDVPSTEVFTSYAQVRRIQFAFNAQPNGVNYYSCQRRASDGAVRNCNLIGTGSYSLATRGDARVLSLNNVPGIAGQLTYERQLVERNGLVYSASKDKLMVDNNIGLNLIAAEALLARLGL